MNNIAERMTTEEAIDLFASDDVVALGERAHHFRLIKAHPDVVSYVVDRNINYSNVCAAECDFCAFSRPSGHEEGYLQSNEEIARKVEELVAVGGTQVLLQGGLSPDLPFDYYLELLAYLRKRFEIDLHAFSAPEIWFFSRKYKMSIAEVLRELRKAGLNSIPGGGAEILSDRVRRQISRGKCLTREWLDVHEEAHRLGMRTTATMMFGHVETIEDRVEHLNHVRDLQDRTGGFTAFIPWTFQGSNTRMEDVSEVGAADYLKTLSISRLFLDNVQNIQASFVTQGMQIGQLALFFGANDMGGTMMEENVVKATGISNCSNEQEIRSLIEDACFIPRKRNTHYHYLN